MNETTEMLDASNALQPISALESISRAEIDVAISTARRYPRVPSTVKQTMIAFATLDQETAEACFYTLPRGGKSIQGPSVRLAEIAVSCYGNIKAGSRILETVTTGDAPHVLVQAVCMDLERNITVSIEKRRRITKKKSKETIDEDDINLAANAGSAIAFRDAVFKVVPLALIKPVYEQAKKVAIGDATTFVNKRARWLDYFAKMGVSQKQILEKLERKTIEDITAEDIGTLIGLSNAIREGEIKVDDAFAVAPVQNRPTSQEPQMPAAAPAEPEAPKPQPAAKKPATVKSEPKPAVKEPEPEPQPVPEPEKADEAEEAAMGLAPEQSDPQPEPEKSEPAEIVEIRNRLAAANCTENQLVAFCKQNKIMDESAKGLSDMDTKQGISRLNMVLKAWPNVVGKLKQFPA